MRYEADVISRNIKKKNKNRKIFIFLLYLILIPTTLFSLILIIVGLGNSEELPSFLNMEIYEVVSPSMSPRINVGDIIVIKKGIPNDSFHVGNIITYKREDGEIITHRIEEIIKYDLRNAYKTKGDSNEAIDDYIVTYDKIIGKVIYVMPQLGKIVKVMKNEIFLVVSILLLCLVLVYDKRIKDRREQRKKIRERYEKKSGFYF